MMPECKLGQSDFNYLLARNVTVRFDGRNQSPEAGGLFLAEVGRRPGPPDRLAA